MRCQQLTPTGRSACENKLGSRHYKGSLVAIDSLNMQSNLLDVLFEDNHLLVANKPAGLATMGTSGQSLTLVEVAKRYVKQAYQKPGNVYLGVVSRLDAATSGAIVLARTSKGAARLSQAFRERHIEKDYLALVDGQVDPPEGRLECYLAKNESRKCMQVVPASAAGAQLARLEYRVVAQHAGRSLLTVRLLTGRKHQIRVQLAELGHPVIGDAKYGSPHRFAEGIALHSSRLAFPHPIGGRTMECVAPLPACWARWCHAAVRPMQ
jgi:23S rRNA pseudouridine1911/1915/1917 synthase